MAAAGGEEDAGALAQLLATFEVLVPSSPRASGGSGEDGGAGGGDGENELVDAESASSSSAAGTKPKPKAGGNNSTSSSTAKKEKPGDGLCDVHDSVPADLNVAAFADCMDALVVTLECFGVCLSAAVKDMRDKANILRHVSGMHAAGSELDAPTTPSTGSKKNQKKASKDGEEEEEQEESSSSADAPAPSSSSSSSVAELEAQRRASLGLRDLVRRERRALVRQFPAAEAADGEADRGPPVEPVDSQVVLGADVRAAAGEYRFDPGSDSGSDEDGDDADEAKGGGGGEEVALCCGDRGGLAAWTRDRGVMFAVAAAVPSQCATRTLLRLHWALEFTAAMLVRLFPEDPDQDGMEVAAAAGAAYAETLAHRHPWPIRMAAKAAVHALPYRRDLLERMGYDQVDPAALGGLAHRVQLAGFSVRAIFDDIEYQDIP